ncbi:hypothetical protein CsatB_013712 [Cannabis sativa]
MVNRLQALNIQDGGDGDVRKNNDGREGTVGPGVERPGGGAAIQQIRTVSTRRKESLAGELQQKGVTQPLPCVIAGDHPMATLEKNPMDDEVILSIMPNVGPSAAQMLDKPHELVCKSRTPHQYPEPVPVAWNIGLGFEKNVAQALEVEVGRVGNKEKGEVLYDGKELKAQAISGPSNKKRKAPVHFIPVDDVGQPIPDGLVISVNGGDSVPPIGSPTFAIGKGNDEDCSGKKKKKNSSSSSKKRGRPRKSSQEIYGRRWNISYVCYLFGVDMGLQISSIDIVGDLGKDRLVWKRTPSGCFSAKEAYWANLQHRLGVDHKIWKRIWSCKIHPRASLFLWRICSGVLPTQDKLGNIDDDRCLLCNGAVESTKHILFECSLTRSLWFGGPIPLRIERLQGENVMSLVLELCGDLEEEEASKLLVCGYVKWDTIWNYRNSIRLGGRCRDCLSLLTEVRKRFEELEGIVDVPASEASTRTTHLVQRAPFNSNILVSDGSFKDGKCALTYNIISRAAFGKKSSDLEEFILIVNDVINYCENFEIGELFHFLSFVDKWGKGAKYESLKLKASKILENIINEKSSSSSSEKSGKEEDLVDVLLKFHYNVDLGFNVTKENIKAVILCRNEFIFQNIAPDSIAISRRVHRRFEEFYSGVAGTQHRELLDVGWDQGQFEACFYGRCFCSGSFCWSWYYLGG